MSKSKSSPQCLKCFQKYILIHGWVDGWMTYNFTSHYTVFDSYQDDVRMVMKGCVKSNPIYSSKNFRFRLVFKTRDRQSRRPALNLLSHRSSSLLNNDLGAYFKSGNVIYIVLTILITHDKYSRTILARTLLEP